MSPLAQSLSEHFISNFWSANRSIKWKAVEKEHSVWLTPQTLLVGRIDALGVTEDGEPFFAEWKSASAGSKRYMDRIKKEWRTNPQALTYGVLGGDLVPGMRRFTVRWMFKPQKEGDVVTSDFEWYSYSDAEVEWWRTELIRLAADIRSLRLSGRNNWPTNFNNCLRYGEKYACPFYEEGCSKVNFNFVPLGMLQRTPHLQVEHDTLKVIEQPDLGITHPEVVIIDATRAELFTDCREKYRRLYENGGLHEDSVALQDGKDMHNAIAKHIGELIV